MSWSKQFKWENCSLTENDNSPKVELSEESLDQLNVAKRAVNAIILTGAMGSVDETYNVSLTGHSNPGHEKTPGWSNDSLIINIYQV